VDGLIEDAPRAPSRSQFAILLALRFKLLLRQFVSGRRRIVSAIILVVIVLPLAVAMGLGLSWLTAGLLASGPGARAEEFIHLVFLVVFVMLTITPVLGFRGSEFYDVSKLFIYPVRQSTVFAAVATGLMTSGSVLFFLPMLVLPLLRLPGGPGLVVFRLASVALFLFMAVAIGQLLVYAMLGFLRSRRFRDLATVLGPMLGAATYLGSRALTTGGVERLGEVLDSQPSGWFRVVPSYWITASAASLDGPGLGGWLLLGLGVLPLLVLVIAAASSLQERAFLGEVKLSVVASGIRSGRRSWLRRLLARFFPDDLRAIAGKELRSLRREPMVKTLLVHQSAFILIPILFSIFGLQRGGGSPDTVRSLYFVPALLLFVEQTLLLNNLGLEGGGYVMLAGTPVPRGRILLGKNLAHGLLFGTINAGLVLLAAVLAAVFTEAIAWADALRTAATSIFAGTLGLVVVIALGNLVSPYAPTRLTVKTRRALRQQQSGREGCSTALLRIMSMIVMLLVLLPVAAALFLPLFVDGLGAWFVLVAAPFATVYAGLIWAGSLRLGGAALSRREPRLIAFFARAEE